MPPHKTWQVLLPLKHPTFCDYTFDTTYQLGDWVRVPLRSQVLIGVVWRQSTLDIDPRKLKPIHNALTYLPPLPPCAREFLAWVADYTLHQPSEIFRMMRPRNLWDPISTKPNAYTLTEDWSDRWSTIRQTPARQQIIDRCQQTGHPVALDKSSVLKGLIDYKVIEPTTIDTTPSLPTSNPCQLSPAQQDVATGMETTNKPILLQGLTGSGKTEVYLWLTYRKLQAKGQVLVLLPEIGLSNQWLKLFEQRFGLKPHIWHADVGKKAKQRTWQWALSGDSGVVVGARSALFLPFANLQLIVVDEEHDPTYKQEDSVRYHARDLAIMKGYFSGAQTLMASATPSVESYHNVQQGKYAHYQLHERFTGASLPPITLIDLRKHKPPRHSWISTPLKDALKANLDKGQQSLLFLNRRGYAPFYLCGDCGEPQGCPACDVSLTYHKKSNRLKCHYCGFFTNVPTQCPLCDATDSLKPCGPGVERLAEDIAHLFPSARLSILSSDTLTSPTKLNEAMTAITQGTVDIIIGTQLVTKGHNFPKLTLIGVIDGDSGFKSLDLRAAERTYQTFIQVTGRAGRFEDEGKAYIQTHMPEHPVLQSLKDLHKDSQSTAFYDQELSMRQGLGFPPYGRFAAILISGNDEAKVVACCKWLNDHKPTIEGVEILGPVSAPIMRINHTYRWRFLVRTPKNHKIQSYLNNWVTALPASLSRPVRVTVDIDPYSFT
jgi:primosomal protein N' (replication factor Y)